MASISDICFASPAVIAADVQLVSVEDGVGVVTLNRPDVYNAFNSAMQRARATLGDAPRRLGLVVVGDVARSIDLIVGDAVQLVRPEHEAQCRAARERHAPVQPGDEALLSAILIALDRGSEKISRVVVGGIGVPDQGA